MLFAYTCDGTIQQLNILQYINIHDTYLNRRHDVEHLGLGGTAFDLVHK